MSNPCRKNEYCEEGSTGADGCVPPTSIQFGESTNFTTNKPTENAKSDTASVKSGFTTSTRLARRNSLDA
ncbi:hypothetical protein BC938DRAFT_483204 [Jimgerdemannia flammicorona]|uniref:Uncharacterized protein n=1 Tax=Jimgerdemannia flammicorona TaxID=994334 RepID=A0A433QCG2_9FUNG|nr:hypothetical protein BC938DRAFT_483204 [Jimgerdemannia flammicorona]